MQDMKEEDEDTVPNEPVVGIDVRAAGTDQRVINFAKPMRHSEHKALALAVAMSTKAPHTHTHQCWGATCADGFLAKESWNRSQEECVETR
eukprot:1879073-Amphidinium_carterae.1